MTAIINFQSHEETGVIKTAIKMFEQRLDIKLIASVTGLSEDQLLKIKSETKITQ